MRASVIWPSALLAVASCVGGTLEGAWAQVPPVEPGRALVAAPSAPEQGEAQRDEVHGSGPDGFRDLETIERLLQTTERHITIALSIGGFLVALLSVLLPLMQHRWEREHKAEWESWKSDFEKRYKESRGVDETEQKKSRNNLLRHLEDRVNELRRLLLQECSKEAIQHSERRFELLAEEFRPKVLEQTKFYTKEVLMQTPAARNILVGRFRRLCQELEAALNAAPPGREAQAVLSRAVQDWHTLGQLYSVDPLELKQGLGACHVSPIPEARGRLGELKIRFQDDVDVAQLVQEAVESLEREAVG